MIKNYYDDLAPYYKRLYPDWDRSVQRQAKILDRVFNEYFGGHVKTILDVACGIGTQTIGLAKAGYQVTASDLSPSAVKHAREEAKRYDVQVDFRVGDMRETSKNYSSQFDIVMACDNSIPHLLTDEEIFDTFRQFYRCTAPNGGSVISVRDYTKLEVPENRIIMNPRLVHQHEEGRTVLFDVWEYSGKYYDMTTYVVEDFQNMDVETQVIRGGRYYCVSISTLEDLYRNAGFSDVITLYDVFFQPLIIAKK